MGTWWVIGRCGCQVEGLGGLDMTGREAGRGREGGRQGGREGGSVPKVSSHGVRDLFFWVLIKLKLIKIKGMYEETYTCFFASFPPSFPSLLPLPPSLPPSLPHRGFS